MNIHRYVSIDLSSIFFSAIQNDECRCRRHDPLPQITQELECSTFCPGNANQTCGDVHKYVSVYATGNTVELRKKSGVSTKKYKRKFFVHWKTWISEKKNKKKTPRVCPQIFYYIRDSWPVVNVVRFSFLFCPVCLVSEWRYRVLGDTRKTAST